MTPPDAPDAPPQWLVQATAASESSAVSRDVLRHFLGVALKELAYRTRHEQAVVAADTEAIVNLRAELARRGKEGSGVSLSETSANKPQHAVASPADAPRDLLDEVEQALKAATPGPWSRVRTAVLVRDGGGIPQNEANADLIAHAPEWLALLVQRVRTAEAEQVRLSGTLTQRVRDAEAETARLREALQPFRGIEIPPSWRDDGLINLVIRSATSERELAVLTTSQLRAVVGASRPGEPQP